MTSDLRYPYRPNRSFCYMAIAALAVAAVTVAIWAWSGEHRLAPLSVRGTQILYGLWSGLVALMTVFGIHLEVRRWKAKPTLVLNETSIRIPRGLFPFESRAANLNEVTAVVIPRLDPNRIKIRHSRGTLTVEAVNLPSRAAFDELYRRLRLRCAHLQSETAA